MILNHINDADIQDSVQSCRDMTYHQTPGAYLRGVRKAHYPVPSTIGECFITPHCVTLLQAYDFASNDAMFWSKD